MKIIHTIFDYKQSVPKPLYSVYYDADSKNLKFYKLYMRGLGTKLKTVLDNLRQIARIIKSNPVFINDLTSHLRFIDIQPNQRLRLYEPFRQREIPHDSESQAQKELCKIVDGANYEPQKWMRTKAMAAVIYARMEKRGVRYGHKIVHPIYDMHTFSGRSRSTGFNIQGTNERDPVENLDTKRNYFIYFDWLAADIRMAGLLSGDEDINQSFESTDPYSMLTEQLNDDAFEITRDQCKLELLSSLYALNIDNPILNLFPRLRQWIVGHILDYKDNKPYHTILGMPIPRNKIKTSFNAIIQGSIAEAMQWSLVQLGKLRPDLIVTEVHDSLILASSHRDLKATIEIGQAIMSDPFRSILDPSPRFPVHISIGKRWKRWKYLKTYRGSLG